MLSLAESFLERNGRMYLCLVKLKILTLQQEKFFIYCLGPSNQKKPSWDDPVSARVWNQNMGRGRTGLSCGGIGRIEDGCEGEKTRVGSPRASKFFVVVLLLRNVY
jgi:hypothetical protein